MLKENYKRYLLSFKTVSIVVSALLLTLLSFYFTYLEKYELVQIITEGSADLNVDAIQYLIDSYNGFRYFFTFYNMSDEFSVMILVLFGWIGIFLSSDFLQQKENGYGNLIVIRSGYKNYSDQLLLSQSLYIATVLAMIVGLQLIFAFMLGGAKTTWYLISDNSYGFGACAGIIGITYLLLVIYCVCINVLSISCTHAIHSRYLMQSIPLLLFAIIPMIVGSTVANVMHCPQILLDIILPFNYLTCIFRMLNNFYAEDLIALIVSLLIFSIGACLLWNHNCKKIEGNYV